MSTVTNVCNTKLYGRNFSNLGIEFDEECLHAKKDQVFRNILSNVKKKINDGNKLEINLKEWVDMCLAAKKFAENQNIDFLKQTLSTYKQFIDENDFKAIAELSKNEREFSLFAKVFPRGFQKILALPVLLESDNDEIFQLDYSIGKISFCMKAFIDRIKEFSDTEKAKYSELICNLNEAYFKDIDINLESNDVIFGKKGTKNYCVSLNLAPEQQKQKYNKYFNHLLQQQFNNFISRGLIPDYAFINTFMDKIEIPAKESFNPSYLFKVFNYFRKKKFEEAFKLIQKNAGIEQQVGIEKKQPNMPIAQAKAIDQSAASKKIEPQAASQALFYLGYCYQHGIGTTKDPTKAVECYRDSIKLNGNNSNALNALGYCYETNRVTLPNNNNTSQAFEYYKRAAELNNIDGLNNLAYCYYKGVGIEKNREKAIEYFNKANEEASKIANSVDKPGVKGDGYALCALSTIEKDFNRIINHLKQAAKAADFTAIFKLAYFYQNPKKLMAAFDYFLNHLYYSNNKEEPGKMIAALLKLRNPSLNKHINDQLKDAINNDNNEEILKIILALSELKNHANQTIDISGITENLVILFDTFQEKLDSAADKKYSGRIITALLKFNDATLTEHIISKYGIKYNNLPLQIKNNFTVDLISYDNFNKQDIVFVLQDPKTHIINGAVSEQTLRELIKSGNITNPIGKQAMLFYTPQEETQKEPKEEEIVSNNLF